MQVKFALTPDDYIQVSNEYDGTTAAGRKRRRAVRMKMLAPIAVLAVGFYALRRDLNLTLALILISALVVYAPAPLKLATRRFRNTLFKGTYADKFKETLYQFEDKGLWARNREKKSFTAWKDVELIRKGETNFWFRTKDNQFFVFPKMRFDQAGQFESAHAFAASRIPVEADPARPVS